MHYMIVVSLEMSDNPEKKESSNIREKQSDDKKNANCTLVDAISVFRFTTLQDASKCYHSLRHKPCRLQKARAAMGLSSVWKTTSGFPVAGNS